MPDFFRMLQEQLGSQKISQDVLHEFASHLEETYETEQQAGRSHEKAMEAVANLIGDRRRLLRSLEGEEMRSISNHIVLPGLFGSLICVIGYQLLELSSKSHLLSLFIGPRFAWGRAGFVPVSLPMTGFLLVAGAVAAFASAKLDGNRSSGMLAALLPSMFLLIAFAVEFSFELVRLGIWKESVPIWAFAGFFLGFVVIPAAVLLIGALPILSRQTDRRAIAS
jgi:hypothetical protein